MVEAMWNQLDLNSENEVDFLASSGRHVLMSCEKATAKFGEHHGRR